MLKLPKGLKKKKKDKKSKKNQELFTEEELAAYKQREQREKQEAAEAAAQQAEAVAFASSSTKPPPAADDADEWRKFAALTSGIDTVLKKTQGNLDRLKESSFYQREPTKCEKEEQQRAEARQREEAVAAAAAAEAERQRAAAAAAEQAKRDADPGVVELSESESESEEADDCFDTTYIDDLASRGVELFVPDSPAEEDADAGPDPFDTDYAERVIKGPEVSSRGKKLVHIGAAVEVLTGRVDKVTSTSAVRRPRRGIQNLLLQSFDEGGSAGAAAEEGSEGQKKVETPVRTLLDDIPDDIPSGPIDLSVSLHLQFIKPPKKEEDAEGCDATTAVSVAEFDHFAQDAKDEFDDEFAELAAESLTANKDVHVLKEVPGICSVPAVATEVTGNWASFQPDPSEKGASFKRVVCV